MTRRSESTETLGRNAKFMIIGSPRFHLARARNFDFRDIAILSVNSARQGTNYSNTRPQNCGCKGVVFNKKTYGLFIKAKEHLGVPQNY